MGALRLHRATEQRGSMRIAATFVLVLGMTACGGGTGAEFDGEPVDAAGASAGGAASTGGSDAGGEVAGGATATGGSATGGAETGGTTTGGVAATGGAATGGVETGGSATGGLAATGGQSQSGGTATGGSASGGVGGGTGGQVASTGGKGSAGGAASTGGAAASGGTGSSCICTTGVCCDGCRLRARGYDLGEQLFSDSCDKVVAPPAYDVLRQEYRKMTCTGESSTEVVAASTTGRWVTTMCAYQHCVDSGTSAAYCKP